VSTFRGSEEEAAASVDSQNLERRHLTAEQQRERRIAKVKELREKGMSTRAIAEELGTVKQLLTGFCLGAWMDFIVPPALKRVWYDIKFTVTVHPIEQRVGVCSP
jgi:hypothetical protein